jgi:hypothetical protein
MNQKKKSCRALGLDSGLDLAISRFTNSLAYNSLKVLLPPYDEHLEF